MGVDVCIPPMAEQEEVGIREVKSMVLLSLHVLAEPYSECLSPSVCGTPPWLTPTLPTPSIRLG